MRNFIKGIRSIDEKKKSKKILYSCVVLGSAYLVFTLSDINAISLKFSTPSVSKKAEGNESVDPQKIPPDNSKMSTVPQEQQKATENTMNQTMEQGSTNQSGMGAINQNMNTTNNNPAMPANQQPGLDPMSPGQQAAYPNQEGAMPPNMSQDNSNAIGMDQGVNKDSNAMQQSQDHAMMNDPMDPNKNAAAVPPGDPTMGNIPPANTPPGETNMNAPAPDSMGQPQVQPAPVPATTTTKPNAKSQKKKT